MTTIVYGVGQTVRGPNQQDDFTYSVVETPLVVGGTAADSGYYDATNSLTTSSGIVNNCRLQVSDSFTLPGYRFVNQAPAVASVDSLGNIAMSALGTAQIDIVARGGTRRFTRAMTNNGTTALSFKAYKAGSLGAHVVANINAMIAAKTPGIGTQQFTTANNFNTAAPTVTRNPNLFTSAYDTTAISVMRSGQPGAKFPALLISARHAICAQHIAPAVGETIVWLDSVGVYHTATITSRALDVNNDIAVLYLSVAITGIPPFTFLPLLWANYLQSQVDQSSTVQHMPCLDRLYHPDDTDSYLSAMCVVEMVILGSVNSGTNVTSIYKPWTDGALGVRDGDSGSPIMLPINGKLVLVSAHYTANGGANWVTFNTWIEAQMNSLATAAGDATVYAMLRADLSVFTQFTVK